VALQVLGTRRPADYDSLSDESGGAHLDPSTEDSEDQN